MQGGYSEPFWEPFIEDIQDSRNVFYVRLYDLEEVKEMYPQLEDVSSSTMGLENYRTYDNSNKENGKAAVIDWYYKKNGVLHFVKFCGEKVLEATENEPEKYPNGLYNHGLYPFFLDPLFKLRDTPAGFSFVDICRSCQSNLDELKRDILKNIKVNSQTRSIINSNAGLNIADLNDLSKDLLRHRVLRTQQSRLKLRTLRQVRSICIMRLLTKSRKLRVQMTQATAQVRQVLHPVLLLLHCKRQAER